MVELNDLNNKEKSYLVNILNQLKNKGSSNILDDLWSADYYEKPVSINEFLSNDEYLGKSLKDKEGNLTIYDYWIDKLNIMFSDESIQEVALSGCIGSGKSTCAVIGMLYFLYRLLCLKSPSSYYNLTNNSTIAIAFFNITLSQSYGVAYSKLQNYCKDSPWFLRHGKLLGRTNPTYYPDKIDILVGSKADHFIGHDIFCLSGDTIVKTLSGDKFISDLENNPEYLYTIDYNENVSCTNYECMSLVTRYVDELVEIELEDGTIIKCTPNHLFLTKEGIWRHASDLIVGDDLYEV